jgi:hypothetical protein
MVRIDVCAFVVIELTMKAHCFSTGIGRQSMLTNSFGRDSEANRMKFGAVIYASDLYCLGKKPLHRLGAMFSLCPHLDAALRLHGAEEDVPLCINGRIAGDIGGKTI